MIMGTDYLHYDLSVIGERETILVNLQSQAYVRLLDQTNYYNYINSRPYNYYGGLVTVNPYKIKPPNSAHWHLIIDLGGSAGHIKAQVQILR